jgi:hypothetical protein
MKKPELEIFQSIIVLTLSLLIIFGGLEYLFDMYLSIEYSSCINKLDVEFCNEELNIKTIAFSKAIESGGWIWIFASSLGVMGMITPFKQLKKIQKEKSLFAFTSCPICDYEPISWDAKTCPKCGTSEVNQRLFGYNFVFSSHLFYFFVCIGKAF